MPGLSDTALRCLLVLIHQSFRFDPEASRWTCPERSFSRQEIETATGLSDQGTRNGLTELEEAGWADVDRSGQSYHYTLRMGVPTQRYTYVPTALLEEASDLPSATALRVLLAVLRATWGWTSKEHRSGETASQTAQKQTVHQRWAELSTSTLSGLTGCSGPAIREAIGALEGLWISRVQPGHGAYLYRILPGAFDPEEKAAIGEESHPEKPSSNPSTANEFGPDRQRNCHPCSSYKESSCRDKQSRETDSEKDPNSQTEPSNPKQGAAVPVSQNESGKETTDTDLSEFSDRKESLYRKLTNAGVWPDRATECLRRYSPARIEANFKLFRERAPEIDDHGAWLCAAITDGYADLGSKGSFSSPDSRQDSQRNQKPTPRSGPRSTDFGPDSAGNFPPDAPGAEGSSPPAKPSHKQRVSPREKDALLRHYETISPDQFHRFRLGESPTEKQFLFFESDKGGPTARRRAV